MEIMTYKSLEWYVMKESRKEKLLLLKDCFTNEMIKKYFDEYDCGYDVQFNKDYAKIWWKDSYIRKVLNEEFILDLDIKDLNVMKTTLSLNEQTSTTEDYVRLLTIEEARYLKKQEESVLYPKRRCCYFTMSPAKFGKDWAYVFRVCDPSPGFLDLDYITVSASLRVRPVIALKNNTISDEEFKSEFRKYLSL